MKKLVLIAFVGLLSFGANAQAQKYLNFGGLGTGLYAGLEFPVASAITIGPHVACDYNFEDWILAAKGNFYFDDLFELNSAWDVYAGANLGYRLDNNNDNNGKDDNDGFWLGAQIGARWFWSDKWGINAEFGGGRAVLGGVGITMKM